MPNLKALVAPRSMAVVGASGDITKWGGSALRSILDGGYTGTIYPVNPKGGEFFGLQAYTSIDELPEAPDLALLAVGGHQIAPMLEQCGRKGIKAAIAIAAGFSETGEGGAEAEREIARIATEGGVTLMGPNCMGMISNEVSLHAVGFVVLHPPKGSLSFVSQSGNIGVQTTNSCQRRGIGIDKFLERGQRGADGRRRGVRLPPRRPEHHEHHGLHGRHRRRPPLHGGGQADHGREAASSCCAPASPSSAAGRPRRTPGAMAGNAAVWEAAARQCGRHHLHHAPRKWSISAPAWPTTRCPRAGGWRSSPTAAARASWRRRGGPRTACKLAEFPAELYAALDEILPPFWSRHNPLDMVASAGGDVGPRVLKAVAECDGVDADHRAVVPRRAHQRPRRAAEASARRRVRRLSPWETDFMTLVADLMEKTGKPIINVPDMSHPGLGVRLRADGTDPSSSAPRRRRRARSTAWNGMVPTGSHTA